MKPLQDIKILPLLLILIFAGGCKKKSCDDKDWTQYSRPVFSLEQEQFTDDELYSVGYSDYKYPLNFYTEDSNGSLNYVTNHKIDSAEDKTIYLSSLSVDEAEQWIRYDAKANDIIEVGNHTEKYFEFIKIQKYPILFRVNRKDYLDRDSFDLKRTNTNEYPYTLGHYNNSMTKEKCKELIDYLWYIKNYNSYGKSVMSSIVTEESDKMLVTHHEHNFNQGDWDLSDSITWWKVEYSVNKETGEILVLSRTLMKALEGKLNCIQ